MSYSGNGLWLGDIDTKIPALAHTLSYRVQLANAGTTQTVALPDSSSNPAQVVKVNPLAPNNTPQQGPRFFPYLWVVRDPAGVLAPAGTSSGGTVALINQTQSNATVVSLTSTPGATSPVAQYVAMTSVPVVINAYDQLAITYTQSGGATATVTGFSVDLFGYWQQGV